VSTAQVSAGATATGVQRARDPRTFWRVLLAVAAALPFLAKGIEYAITPLRGGEDFADTVAVVEAHPALFAVDSLLNAIFVVGLIPATIALAWVTRRRTPMLTAVAGILSLVGFFAVLGHGVDDIAMARVTAAESLDVAAVARLNEAWWATPLPSVTVLMFLVGLVIGLPLLGLALWRGRVVPRWMALCLILGTVTHPFVPGHVAAGVGLVVAGIGFLGVSRVLLRTSNDQFDLPPVPRTVSG
jgi:hypothetical protein